jgi:hypothetical protein
MESERDLESIMEITADDAISIFEQTCLGIAMQLGKIQELGDDEESNPTDDFVGVMKRSADAVGSFKDYILSHSSSGGSTMFHYAACTMLWMDRVHLYIVSKAVDQTGLVGPSQRPAGRQVRRDRPPRQQRGVHSGVSWSTE